VCSFGLLNSVVSRTPFCVVLRIATGTPAASSGLPGDRPTSLRIYVCRQYWHELGADSK